MALASVCIFDRENVAAPVHGTHCTRIRCNRRGSHVGVGSTPGARDGRAAALRAGERIHSAPNPVFASGDWNRLIQVVGNLLQSAAKFTSRSGLTNVTIQAESHRAVVKISDTGVGVAPEVLARLLSFAGVTLACHIEVEAWHARAMAYISTP